MYIKNADRYFDNVSTVLFDNSSMDFLFYLRLDDGIEWDFMISYSHPNYWLLYENDNPHLER